MPERSQSARSLLLTVLGEYMLPTGRPIWTSGLVSVLGGSPWDRFSPDVDYRKVPTTKPHRAHPNFIFFLDGKPWVTRFNQRDAVPVDGVNGRPPFDIGREEGVHDGHIVGGGLFFTTVGGCVVRCLRSSQLSRPSASPAAGSQHKHEVEQEQLLEASFVAL